MGVRQSRAQAITLTLLIAGLGAGIFAARFSGPASGDVGAALGGPVRVLLLLVPAAILLTSLHEAAHAVVGRLVGWRVFGVTIGQGRRHATLHVGSVRLDLRGLFVGGVTLARPTGHRGRDAAMLVAGVTLELAVIVVTLLWSPGSDWGQSAKWAVLIVAVIDITTNLWPRRVDVGAMTGMATDGAQLVSVITTPDRWRHDIDRTTWTPERVALIQTLHGGDVDVALDLARAEAAADPDDEELRTLLGTIMLLAGQWRDAYDELTPLAERPDADALLANNAAWAAVMSFEPALLPVADRLSERALAELPSEPACASTRGSTLVRLGRAREGLALLETAAGGRLSHQQKAFVLAFTALAAHRLGDDDAAARHLERSEQLHATCAALPGVRTLMVHPPAPIAPVEALAAWPPAEAAPSADGS